MDERMGRWINQWNEYGGKMEEKESQARIPTLRPLPWLPW